MFGWGQVCNAQQLRLVYMATKDNLDKAVIKTKNEVNHPYKVLPIIIDNAIYRLVSELVQFQLVVGRHVTSGINTSNCK